MRRICAQLRRWLDEGKNPPPVSVNVSRYDLLQKDFLDVIGGLIKRGFTVEIDDYGLADKIVLTLREASPAK